jgi:hypothetical protein
MSNLILGQETRRILGMVLIGFFPCFPNFYPEYSVVQSQQVLQFKDSRLPYSRTGGRSTVVLSFKRR